MNKRTTGDAVRGDEVLGRTLSQTDNGPSPAEPSSGPPNRKVLRTLALVVLLGIAGVVAWAKWATVSSIFHGGNGLDRIIGLSGESKAMIRPSLRRLAVGYLKCAFTRETASTPDRSLLSLTINRFARAKNRRGGLSKARKPEPRRPKHRLTFSKSNCGRANCRPSRQQSTRKGASARQKRTSRLPRRTSHARKLHFNWPRSTKRRIRGWRKREPSPNARGKRRWPMQISRPPPWPPPNDGSRRRRER